MACTVPGMVALLGLPSGLSPGRVGVTIAAGMTISILIERSTWQPRET